MLYLSYSIAKAIPKLRLIRTSLYGEVLIFWGCSVGAAGENPVRYNEPIKQDNFLNAKNLKRIRIIL
jgi:hypothetical protein